MNIEEAIEILKNSKKLYLKEKIDSDILEEAIETLLTAYEKEKEKNKKIENDIKIITKKYMEAESVKFWHNYIHKDKIKAKIEELEDYIEENSDGQGYWGDKKQEDIYEVIDILQSLLEKE